MPDDNIRVQRGPYKEVKMKSIPCDRGKAGLNARVKTPTELK